MELEEKRKAMARRSSITAQRTLRGNASSVRTHLKTERDETAARVQSILDGLKVKHKAVKDERAARRVQVRVRIMLAKRFTKHMNEHDTYAKRLYDMHIQR